MPNGNQQSRRGRGRGRAAINRANNAESLANTQSLPRDTRASTPEDPDMLAKQQEFRDWCARMQFPDGDMVTEAKLVLFLTELVETRGLELESRSPSLSPDLPQRETTTNSSREQEARDIDPDNPPCSTSL
ncbi:hypothetical protein N7535_006647 [Penicillium sp. DV-2018c]|nr:hypothetical protein N7461_007270 [Penicillium sp. DV-2018c]KAJ5567341.1 hypothetical protein N7535_006647 [Penicillium sp. DV-2018c]